eukprot:gene11384-13454_t
MPYEIALYPYGEQHDFRPGDPVFVKLGKQCKGDSSAGVVLRPALVSTAITVPTASECADVHVSGEEYPDRVLVQYNDDAQTYYAWPRRVHHIFGPNRIIICRDTAQYRVLARTQVRAGDSCVEIGCSYGEATTFLLRKCLDVVGIDISRECIDFCTEKYPRGEFLQLDCVEDPKALANAADATSGRCTKLFIDIGGNRSLSPLVKLIPLALSTLQPELVVIKSEELHRMAEEHLNSVDHLLVDTLPSSRNTSSDQLPPDYN